MICKKRTFWVHFQALELRMRLKPGFKARSRECTYYLRGYTLLQLNDTQGSIWLVDGPSTCHNPSTCGVKEINGAQSKTSAFKSNALLFTPLHQLEVNIASVPTLARFISPAPPRLVPRVANNFFSLQRLLSPLQCHVSIIPIYSCMKDRGTKNFAKTVLLAIAVCLFAYSVSATLGELWRCQTTC